MFQSPSYTYHPSVSNTRPIKFRLVNLTFQVLYTKAVTVTPILPSSLSHTCPLLEITYIPAMRKTDCLPMNLGMLLLRQFLLFKILPFTQGHPPLVYQRGYCMYSIHFLSLFLLPPLNCEVLNYSTTLNY